MALSTHQVTFLLNLVALLAHHHHSHLFCQVSLFLFHISMGGSSSREACVRSFWADTTEEKNPIGGPSLGRWSLEAGGVPTVWQQRSVMVPS